MEAHAKADKECSRFERLRKAEKAEEAANNDAHIYTSPVSSTLSSPRYSCTSPEYRPTSPAYGVEPPVDEQKVD
jgi:hypothetical protein